MKSEKTVQYELMKGREATEAIRACPVSYLPIGCLERHGDHLPMGLDVIKAHKVCCAAARAIGGVVFPPHFYSGIHALPDKLMALYTGEWGNLYTDRTTKDNLVEIIRQFAIMGVKVLVLYSGHYPRCQVDMIREITELFAKSGTFKIVPFAECMILDGDHAGISETSFLLYLDKSLVDMTRIGAVNYREHSWNEGNSPEKATAEKGKQDVAAVIAYLKDKVEKALAK